MSLNFPDGQAQAALPAHGGWRIAGLRVALALAAFVTIILIMAGAAALFSHAAAPAPRNPFAGGIAEPVAGGRLGAALAILQSSFYRALTDGLQGALAHGAGLFSLLGVAFAYGVFHAAGPGHGKAVISGYLGANERTLARGAALSWAAALLQACVAVAMALAFSVIFNATAATVKLGAAIIEAASFALVAALGLALTWRKAGALARLAAADGSPGAARAASACCDASCGHAHMPGADEAARATDWRAMAGVVLAAGLRPCSGALILLAFALSQDALATGVAATFAMAAGTAITTTAIAAIAVFAKRLALSLAGGGAMTGARMAAALELLAGAFLLATGLILLLGPLLGGAPFVPTP